MRFSHRDDSLVLEYGNATVMIAPWGADSLRVRMTREARMDANDWALTEPVEHTPPVLLTESVNQKPSGALTVPVNAPSDSTTDNPRPVISIYEVDVTEPWLRHEPRHHRSAYAASISNGRIRAEVSFEGWISFYNDKGELLTAEYWRDRNRVDRYAVPLRIEGRELKPITGTSDYALCARFEAFDGERIYGMGQYQEAQLDKKGASLELCHRNSQASVPFFISSRGYGFFWNNPAIGSATFATNKTEWTAHSTKKLDYFITAADTPAAIQANYLRATGFSPMMPEHGLGFWQCKLRYRNQDEIMAVVREQKRRGLPLDVIVVDFFHWTIQGDYRFEPRDWPDPEAMVRECRELGVEVAVSVWPTIDERSENHAAMAEQGLLVGCDRGSGFHMNWMGNTTFYDATHPGARAYVWQRCKENYYDKGIRTFWLDEAEPEYGPYDFDIFRYHAGPALQCSNAYPVYYAQGFYDGLSAVGEKEVMSLVRCAWAGSQKYGVLAWSGDISSTFRALREQLQAGLSIAVAGIPWWTSDIGGFFGGDVNDPAFHELLIRWFEWGTFCPVMRLHGDRPPLKELETEYVGGVRLFSSGQDNEVWSYGEANYEIMKKYLLIRERLRDYIREGMRAVAETGMPLMRPLFFDFPADAECWRHEDEYMFGPDILVAPVMEATITARPVYLPEGSRWREAATGKEYAGGQSVSAHAPLDIIPLFFRDGKEYEVYHVKRISKS